MHGVNHAAGGEGGHHWRVNRLYSPATCMHCNIVRRRSTRDIPCPGGPPELSSESDTARLTPDAQKSAPEPPKG